MLTLTRLRVFSTFPGSLKVKFNKKNGAMADDKAPWNDHWVQTMLLKDNEKCLVLLFETKENIQGTFIRLVVALVVEELFEHFWQPCPSIKGTLPSVETEVEASKRIQTERSVVLCTGDPQGFRLLYSA